LRQYGVALYHCGLNSFHIETKEPQRGNGPPAYDQACREYYLERLKKAVEGLKAPEGKRTEAK
jgi:hypothetical protein